MERLLGKIKETYEFCLKVQKELDGKNEKASVFMEGLKEKEKILAESKERIAAQKRETERILAATKETREVILVQHKEMEGKNIIAGKLVGEAKVKEEKLASLEKSLAAREAEVKKVEDIVMLSEETEELAKKTSADIVELNTRRESFVKTQDRVNADHSIRAMELATKEDKVVEKEKRLTDGREQLEHLVAKEVRKILKK